MATAPSTTVLKAFQVLELFAERSLLGAGDAARLLGAPRASAHRLLVTLKAAGVLESTDHGQYRLGLRLFELGSFAPLRQRLHDESMLPLEQLVAQVRLPVHLGVRDGTDVLYLEKVHHREADVPARVGQRGPLHATALGKVLLASAPEEILQRVIGAPLPRFTPRTITTPAQLHRDLAEIRSTGVAYEREESRAGLVAVGTRIRNHTGKAIAAIAIPAPACHYGAKLHVLERPLLRAAAEIERRLGWCPAPGTRSGPAARPAGV